MSAPARKPRPETLTEAQFDAIVKKINGAYRERDDYPPYAMAPWDDRNRLREYIVKLLKEMVGARRQK